MRKHLYAKISIVDPGYYLNADPDPGQTLPPKVLMYLEYFYDAVPRPNWDPPLPLLKASVPPSPGTKRGVY
jgi:hypothetical protein